MNNKKRIYTLKYITYIILLFFFYILQTTPNLFSLWGIKPNLVIPIVISIAMIEGEFVGAIFGVLGGMLCDMSAFGTFGFYSIMLLLICSGVGLLIIYLMKNSVLNAIVLSGAALSLIFLLDFFFMFAMWAYDDVARILIYQTIPCILYSTATAPIFFILFRWLFKEFEVRVKT